MLHKLQKFQQLVGILGVLILWSGIATAMFIGHLRLFDTLPISSLGVNPKTAYLFSLSLLISAALFINFAYYVRRTFIINNSFLIFFLIGQIGQAIVAIAPYGNHSQYRLLHTIAAFTLAFSLPLLMQQFYYSQKDNTHSHLFKQLLFLEIVLFVVGIGTFIFTQGLAPLGEILPTLGFHLWIVIISIIALKNYQSEGLSYNKLQTKA